MTRDLIIDALTEVIVEQGPRTFSMDDVADRAGVSLRTLYRYYPGREELLAALTERLDEALQLTEEDAAMTNTLDGMLQLISKRMLLFSEHDRLARAALAIIAGSEGRAEDPAVEPTLREAARQRAGRHAHIRTLIRRELPDLPEHMTDQIYAVIRTLGSMVGWGQMTGPAGGLDPESAAIATQWAFKTLYSRANELAAEGIENLEDDL